MTPNKIKNTFKRAAISLQEGNATAAKYGFRKVSKYAPDIFAVWYNLALSHQYLGEHEKAISAYKKSIRLDSNNIDARINLGISHKFLNQLPQAIEHAEQALVLDYKHPRALNLIGSIHAERENYTTAKDYFRKASIYAPNDSETLYNLASIHTQLGEILEAERLVDMALTRLPHDKKINELKAQICINTKDYKLAGRIITALEKEYLDDEAVLRLALTLREVGMDHFGVIEKAKSLIVIDPNDAGLWNSLGGAYFQIDCIKLSKESYEKAVMLDQENCEFISNLGLVHSSLGDRLNAEMCYRKSLSLNPSHGEAHKNLAMMKKFESRDDPDAKIVQDLWEAGGHDTLNTIKLSFALGKIYDDCGHYKKAFETVAVGNDLKFRDSRIDLESYFSHIDRIPLSLNTPPSNHAAYDKQSPLPIFILGMPRSGTTLVEKIISRHPLVTGCGELPCIEQAINHLESPISPVKIYPDSFPNISTDALCVENQKYIEWVTQFHVLQTPYFTDKMPFNFVHIWLISALFPESKIVHCRRHPLDIITSNYFQLFGSDVSFVYNLDSLAKYYVRYHRLMNHWHDVFEGKIIDVKYETLVMDSEMVIKSLISSINLPWDETCLMNKNSMKVIRTASIWQARQDIHSHSKERWRNYTRELQPAANILIDNGILDESLNEI